MKNFGFGVQPGRQINLDLADTAMAVDLSRAVIAWSSCISCGSCSATCTASKNGDFNFRRLHYSIRMGTATILDFQPLVNSCLLCGKCQLICPRGIPTRYLAIRIIQKVKDYAEDIPSV